MLSSFVFERDHPLDSGRSGAVGRKVSFGLAVKSAGPILLPTILKVVSWDYLLFIKSALLLYCLRFHQQQRGYMSGQTPLGFGMLALLLVALDILFSTGLTGGFIRAYEELQADKVAPTVAQSPAFPALIKDFFDEVNFMVADALKNSLYVLNG
jgi:hypothetical protein